MTNQEVTFFVPGLSWMPKKLKPGAKIPKQPREPSSPRPISKGSLSAYCMRGRTPKQDRAIITDMTKGHKEWADRVAKHGRYHWKGLPTTKALKIDCVFTFERPKSHYIGGKRTNKLKATAPKYHKHTPDHEKLARAIFDPLKGIVYRDDSYIVDGWARKEYGEHGGALITIWELEE